MSWRLKEHLSPETYDRLIDIAVPLSCPQGAVLISEGDDNRTLFILESGSLKVSQRTGSVERQLGTIEAGDVIGEIAFVDQRPRSATVTVHKEAQLLKLVHSEVMQTLVNDPRALAELIQALAVRITQRFRNQITEENIQSELSRVSSPSPTAPVGTAQTGETYLEDLVQEALSHPAVSHPYLTDLADGNVPDLDWALRDFAVQYPGYCAHFPRYLTMVISKLESPGHRMTLMQNLIEESGTLDKEEIAVLVEHGIEPDWVQGIPHPKLFERFQNALGARNTDDPGNDALEVVCWRESFYHLLANGSPAEAVGAIGLGTENIVNRIYTSLVRSIERLGTLDRQQYVFFELHCEVDDDHHEALLNIALDFTNDAQDRIDLRKGMLKALGLRAMFWDWMHERARQQGSRHE
ncbi:MAG: iron-containing redox enzyme family protein [Fuerstiella sp.]|nr:iron-containing redox enzyme family protein [Fuerstiella sp.]